MRIDAIILDNNITSQDYPQKYLTCILFYESLYKYKTLQQQIEKIENNKDLFSENNENISLNNVRSTLEEEKKAHYHNPNKNIFEVKYDDLTFKDNQKKINYIQFQQFFYLNLYQL